MVALEIVLTIITVLLYFYYRTHRRPPNFPPGPRGVPFLGYGPVIYGKELPFLCLAKLKPIYGSAMSFPMGTNGYGIVLNDWKATKEAIIQQSDVFSGRPRRNFMMDVFFKRTDIVSIDGTLWRDKRRFSVQNLKELGFGKNSMEDIISGEVDEVLTFFKANEHLVINCDTSDFLFLPILNVIWGIVAGKKYAMDDESMHQFSKTMQTFFSDFQDLVFLNSFPQLRFMPGIRSKFSRCVENHQKITDLVLKHVTEHEQTYEDGTVRDFIDVYLAEINSQKKAAQPNPAFEKKQLLGVIFDFFGAGVETTRNTLMWGYLYMATWPEIQEKMQQELDSVIGNERAPKYSDRPLLPYTEAVLLEVQRYATIVPFSIPHSTMKATTLMGYDIPKDTFVLQNLWSVHHDKEYWGDPEIFRPERFLNKDGKVIKPKSLIPFSTGLRVCLGEPLAKMELFLFFVTILQRYSIRLATGIRPPDLKPVMSATLRPNPYSISIKRRF